jgi:hypothetical protein
MRTQDESEKLFIKSIIKLRDVFLDEDPESLVGYEKSKIIEDLISCYFGERRKRVNVKYPSPLMDFKSICDLIELDFLSYVADEHLGFLKTDWRGLFSLEEEIDFNL